MGADITASQSALIKIDEYLCNPTFFHRKTIINIAFFFSSLSAQTNFASKFIKIRQNDRCVLVIYVSRLTEAPSAMRTCACIAGDTPAAPASLLAKF